MTPIAAVPGRSPVWVIAVRRRRPEGPCGVRPQVTERAGQQSRTRRTSAPGTSGRPSSVGQPLSLRHQRKRSGAIHSAEAGRESQTPTRGDPLKRSFRGQPGALGDAGPGWNADGSPPSEQKAPLLSSTISESRTTGSAELQRTVSGRRRRGGSC